MANQRFYVKLYLKGGFMPVFETEALYGQQAEASVEITIKEDKPFRLTKDHGDVTAVLVVPASSVVAFEYATKSFDLADSEVYKKANDRSYQ